MRLEIGFLDSHSHAAARHNALREELELPNALKLPPGPIFRIPPAAMRGLDHYGSFEDAKLSAAIRVFLPRLVWHVDRVNSASSPYRRRLLRRGQLRPSRSTVADSLPSSDSRSSLE